MVEENKSDQWIRGLLEKISSRDFDPSYEVKGGILYYRGKFCLGPTSDLRGKVLEELHNSRADGHSGYYRTLRRVCQSFFGRE